MCVFYTDVALAFSCVSESGFLEQSGFGTESGLCSLREASPDSLQVLVGESSLSHALQSVL